jgi:hypothetical protein
MISAAESRDASTGLIDRDLIAIRRHRLTARRERLDSIGRPGTSAR